MSWALCLRLCSLCRGAGKAQAVGARMGQMEQPKSFTRWSPHAGNCPGICHPTSRVVWLLSPSISQLVCCTHQNQSRRAQLGCSRWESAPLECQIQMQAATDRVDHQVTQTHAFPFFNSTLLRGIAERGCGWHMARTPGQR